MMRHEKVEARPVARCRSRHRRPGLRGDLAVGVWKMG